MIEIPLEVWHHYTAEVLAGLTLSALGIIGLFFRRRISAWWRRPPVAVGQSEVSTPRPNEALVRMNRPAPSITIDVPRSQDLLENGEPVLTVLKRYKVLGTSSYIPADHDIWLLTKHEDKLWPQERRRFFFDRPSGKWSGYVVTTSGEPIAIVAVAAPETTKDFFEYVRRTGGRTDWEPIKRLPPECTVFCESVDVRAT